MIIRTKLETEEQKKLILEGRLTIFTLHRKLDLIRDVYMKIPFVVSTGPEYSFRKFCRSDQLQILKSNVYKNYIKYFLFE